MHVFAYLSSTRKYLRSFGFAINNDLFAAHSWYFRNALVRANYSNRDKSISYDLSYLECFLRNLVLGESHVLKNRYLHISYQSDGASVLKGQIGTLSVTLEERAVLNCISQNNRIIQKDIATAIGKSERTVKRIMASLSEKGILIRKNGKDGVKYADILLVYATAAQLRAETALSYSNPPAGVKIRLKGLKENADGLYSLSDVQQRLSKAIVAYDAL